MNELLILAGIVVAWVALQRFILPRMGIAT